MARILDWLYSRSNDRLLLIATLKILVRELGGTAVISVNDLEASNHMELDVLKNENPDGLRLVIKRQ